MTFSIVAKCTKTGQLGMAVSSSSPAVAARCAHAKAGVGVVASQNITDPRLGPKILLAMSEGHSAPEAVKMIINAAENANFRQVLAVDGEFMGLNVKRDPLCLIQISTGNNDAHIVQLDLSLIHI